MTSGFRYTSQQTRSTRNLGVPVKHAEESLESLGAPAGAWGVSQAGYLKAVWRRETGGFRASVQKPFKRPRGLLKGPRGPLKDPGVL